MTSFNETVKNIEAAQKNVDRILKAAKLDRIERQPRFCCDYVFAIVILLMSMGFMGFIFSMILWR